MIVCCLNDLAFQVLAYDAGTLEFLDFENSCKTAKTISLYDLTELECKLKL